MYSSVVFLAADVPLCRHTAILKLLFLPDFHMHACRKVQHKCRHGTGVPALKSCDSLPLPETLLLERV